MYKLEGLELASRLLLLILILRLKTLNCKKLNWLEFFVLNTMQG